MGLLVIFCKLFGGVMTSHHLLYKLCFILMIFGAKCITETSAESSHRTVTNTELENQTYYSATTLALATSTIVLAITLILVKRFKEAAVPKNAPPVVPSSIPFLGCAIEFNNNPIQFLIKMREKYGPVFTFEMVGKKFTYLVGSEAGALFFNGKNEDLNAEDVYGKLVTPVFGRGVAYDVPNEVFLEQKKMFKTGLNIARFKDYVHIIDAEVREYLKRWGESGTVDLFEAFSEMIIMTASHCLHGKEIRSVLNERVAHLYMELDQGFCAEAWLTPSWMHRIFPKLRRRDAAHKEMKQIFYSAIAKRRESGEKGEDMLQTLLDTPYKSGRYMNDDEIAGMLIGLLMAGQHTSSSTSAWMGVFLSSKKDVQTHVYEEQLRVRGRDLEPIEYDHFKNMTLLDSVLKETLRLQPPLYTIMRETKKAVDVCGYTIPIGHTVCVSPTTNHKLDDVWGKDTLDFNPDRFLGDDSALTGENKFNYVPFGAGRHRCIGESFAYVQNKTIWSILLELYELDLIGEFPKPNYASMIHTPLNSTVAYRRRQNVH